MKPDESLTGGDQRCPAARQPEGTQMRIIVDHDKCTGLGICESIAEEYFEVADDGALHLLQEQIDPADTERIDDAVRSCPTQALRIGES